MGRHGRYVLNYYREAYYGWLLGRAGTTTDGVVMRVEAVQAGTRGTEVGLKQLRGGQMRGG